MREANFQHSSQTQDNCHSDEFNFGSETRRLDLINDSMFTYGHYKVNDGQATVGGAKVGDNLYFAVALCSPLDNFSKSFGRALVRNHLVSADTSHKRGMLVLPHNEELQPAQALREALVSYLRSMRHKPDWARNAVVTFRTVRKRSLDGIKRPHGAVRRPGSR